tara:strand:- start:521 stop:976 length:456 start_codon:yes stop_codon:yes gene_type:complete
MTDEDRDRFFCKYDNPNSLEQYEDLYIFTCRVGDEVRTKIGVSTDVKQRIKDIQGANAFLVENHRVYDLKNSNGVARVIEKDIKNKFKKYLSHKHTTEWFTVEPFKIQEEVARLQDHYKTKLKKKLKKWDKEDKYFRKTLDPFYTEEGYRN